jgi:hypothetical protein
MDDRQFDQRQESLHQAIGRLSMARELRGGVVDLLDRRDDTFELRIDPETPKRRRGLFSFGDRARRSVED